jgi:uncharacterized protein (TIGR03435 family)
MNATRAVVIVFAASALFAQDSPRVQFEVASIRPSAEQPTGTGTAGVRVDGAQARWTALTIKDYVAGAYRVKAYQVSGPDWIGSDRFDIAATLPAGVPASQIPEMLQHLLEERFQVKLHREKKEFPVYTLEVAKGGLKMQENAPDPAAKADNNAPVNISGSGSAQGISVDLGRGSSYAFSNNKFEAKRLTMAALAANLERFLDRPIVDMTDLKGSYDFSLDFTEEDYRTMLIRAAVNAGVVLPPQALRLLDGGASPISLFDAAQKLGLKLDARKAPLDFLVIDEARKTPTDN